MSKDQKLGKPEDRSLNAGLKRRDLLLSSGSLLAASMLSSTGLTTSAQAQQAPRERPARLARKIKSRLPRRYRHGWRECYPWRFCV